MISSLANFLILVLYRGGFQSRLSWTVMCFTMGIVAVARIAIERDRVYSYGYAAALGLATLLVMSRLVDSLLFCIFILFVVGYLADLIVRDCTLIDDDVDASGEGLIDSGHLFLKKQIEISASEGHRAEMQTGEPEGKVSKPRGKVSQPGRTVMYLAMAALPLFGLGQFFLRNDSASWASAKYLLAFYLFASLSLLVTTSFVGLRRYLRQRKVDMPTDVSVAWLSAGVALIAVVLLLAYFAPMPGRALASFEFPKLFDSPGNTSSTGTVGEKKGQTVPILNHLAPPKIRKVRARNSRATWTEKGANLAEAAMVNEKTAQQEVERAVISQKVNRIRKPRLAMIRNRINTTMVNAEPKASHRQNRSRKVTEQNLEPINQSPENQSLENQNLESQNLGSQNLGSQNLGSQSRVNRIPGVLNPVRQNLKNRSRVQGLRRTGKHRRQIPPTPVIQGNLRIRIRRAKNPAKIQANGNHLLRNRNPVSLRLHQKQSPRLVRC